MYKKPLRFLIFVCLFVLTLLWLSSYTHHTGGGVDHDFEYEDRVLHVFSRISWTGHGSIWIGYGSVWKNADAVSKLEKFDLAAIFFQRVSRPLNAASFWNRAGFWLIRGTEAKPTFWVGIPSWLPVLLLSGLLVWHFLQPQADR